MLFDSKIWKVSAKWATRRHECNLAGITNRCGGMCCSSPAFWPPRAFSDRDATGYGDIVRNGVGLKKTGFACGHLTAAGCAFTANERPVTCLLYPFVLNKSGTLVCHNRITTEKGICKGNHNNGPMIIDVVRGNLVALFGEQQVDRVRAAVVGGRDGYLVVSEDILRQYEKEREWEEENVKPVSRLEY